MDDPRLAREVEDFLYLEAELLDEWKLEAWLDLLTDDVRKIVGSRFDELGPTLIGLVRDMESGTRAGRQIARRMR